MSLYTFNLPDLGEGLKEAELVDWLVSVNDHVVEDQPLISIETDKALVEIPSPVSGVLVAIHAATGDVIEIGAALADFDTQASIDTGAIVGTLATPREPVAESATTSRFVANDTSKSGLAAAQHDSARIKASPAVRAKARELGVNLGAIVPTGKDGSISVADLGRGSQAIPAAEPLKGLRRVMHQKMSAAWQQVVLATVTGTADIDLWYGNEKPLLRMLKAVVAACQAEPALNCWFDAENARRTLHQDVHLGIATDTTDGLLVPTLRDANRLGSDELAAAMQSLSQAAHNRQLSPGQLSGQTISLSNFGSIAGEYAQMIVLPPQVAIVGMGTIKQVPVADNDATAVHALLPLSVSFDHRVVSGGEAAKFLSALIRDLEKNI